MATSGFDNGRIEGLLRGNAPGINRRTQRRQTRWARSLVPPEYGRVARLSARSPKGLDVSQTRVGVAEAFQGDAHAVHRLKRQAAQLAHVVAGVEVLEAAA